MNDRPHLNRFVEDLSHVFCECGMEVRLEHRPWKVGSENAERHRCREAESSAVQSMSTRPVSVFAGVLCSAREGGQLRECVSPMRTLPSLLDKDDRPLGEMLSTPGREPQSAHTHPSGSLLGQWHFRMDFLLTRLTVAQSLMSSQRFERLPMQSATVLFERRGRQRSPIRTLCSAILTANRPTGALLTNWTS